MDELIKQYWEEYERWCEGVGTPPYRDSFMIWLEDFKDIDVESLLCGGGI